MQKHPITGIGPDQWPLIASQYGWPPGKECHSLWFNAGAELGFPGLALLILFYSIIIYHGCRMCFERSNQGTWYADSGRMVTTAIIGFAVSASFVSLDALEPPYYIALLGAATLKVADRSRLPAITTIDALAGLGGTKQHEMLLHSDKVYSP
jgi:hypothetical protein